MKQLIYILSVVALISSCYYDNASEMYPVAQNCDSTNITYTKNMEPIFNSYCGANNSCHSSGVANGGVILDNYNSAAAIDTTTLIGCIEHSSGFVAMPPTGKMNDCGINQVKLWIRSGKPL
jgi:cytochrome c5